jgi:hypothetical protein
MEGDVVAVPDKFGIQSKEREESLAAASSQKSDVVQGH